nr:hypothetical protein [uncultured Ruminococcus sp.]
MKIELYDKVLLTDGRIADIVEILGDNDEYIADIYLDGDYDTVTIYHEQILKVLD